MVLSIITHDKRLQLLRKAFNLIQENLKMTIATWQQPLRGLDTGILSSLFMSNALKYTHTHVNT